MFVGESREAGCAPNHLAKIDRHGQRCLGIPRNFAAVEFLLSQLGPSFECTTRDKMTISSEEQPYPLQQTVKSAITAC